MEVDIRKRNLHIVIGPLLFAIVTFLLKDMLTLHGAMSIGTMVWMIYWWIARPFHIAVAGLIPVIVNALFSITPMKDLTSQYASDSIILIFGSGLLTMPWAMNGLDKRIALKTLSYIGPSMKSQIIVWLLASIALSSVLPNIMVTTVLIPIAIAMLANAGHTDISQSKAATPILLSIAWGAVLGGGITPLGGAMNLVAIDYMEEFTGHEFMYGDWVTQLLPYMIIASIVLLVYMLLMPLETKSLDGTKDYFTASYKALGDMKREEKISAAMFVLALVASFARPLYADRLPDLSPSYIFLILGALNFIIMAQDKSLFLTWQQAEKNTLWGMMISFAGGMALGKLINGSGATTVIADKISSMNLDGGLTTIIIVVIFARLISELTNSTTAAAIVIPIVFAFCSELGLNPVPYWLMTTMAYNADFIFPISVRAVPIAYGVDAGKMMKAGWPISLISMVVIIFFGYLAIRFMPWFGTLPYLN